MDLAISNLAWNNLEEIKNTNIKYIECVFSKIKDINELTEADVLKWNDEVRKSGFIPYSVQSINFNSPIKKFTYDEVNVNFYDKIINFCSLLGLKRIVYGSPTIRSGEVDQGVLNLFKYIDSKLKGSELIWCIEPNSRFYKGDYFFDVEEIVNFLKEKNFNNVKTMIDTHNGILENRNIENDIVKYKDYVEHIHISEKNLMPLENLQFHKEVSNTLKHINYNKVITYETKFLQNIQEFVKIYS